jgi:hypothetical protein
MFINKSFLIFFVMLVPQLLWAVSPGDPILASDITTIRNSVNAKRTCFGVIIQSWTNPSLEPGIPIRSAHILEIRTAIRDLYNRCHSGACASVGVGNVSAGNRAWTDPSLAGQPIKAIHINELITTINSMTCSATSYSWSIGAVTSCSGGSGNWVSSSWSTCNGGKTSWKTGPWGTCSATYGSGTQTRTAKCSYIPDSGTQSRTLTCKYTANSGTGSRSVKCVRSDGVVVADSYCPKPKPLATVQCTPSNPALCGARPATTRKCTPTTVASCSSAPSTTQTCEGIGKRPCGSRPHGTIWQGYGDTKWCRGGCRPGDGSRAGPGLLICDDSVVKIYQQCGCSSSGGR